MKEIKFKGLTIKAPEEVAEILEKEEDTHAASRQALMKAQEVEAFLKELIEWLDSGKGSCVKKCKDLQMKKQVVSGVSPWETTPTVPSGARVSNVGAVSGIVAAPNLPSWLTGNPQGVAAASHLTVSNMAEAFVNAVVTAFNNIINEIANMLASFSSAQARIYHELANTVSEKLDATMETQKEVVDALKDVVEALKEIKPSAEEEGESLLPGGEISAVATSVPPIAPEEVGGTAEGAGAEVAPPSTPPEEGEEAPAPSEEEETQRPTSAAAAGVGGLAFSPQFLTALSQQLSKATREILETYSRAPRQEGRSLPQAQTAFDIAESIASSILGKAGGRQAMKVEEDMTEPIKVARPPEKGQPITAQLEDAPEGDIVRKQREEAKRQRRRD